MKSVKSVVHFLRVCVAALFLATAFAPAPVQAKSVDYSAHFDSETYWNSHAIYLARITNINEGTYVTSFDPAKIISGTVDSKSRSIKTIPDDQLEDGPWRGQYPLGFPQGITNGAQILVCENLSYDQVTVVKVMNFPADQPLVAALEQIAALRKAPAFQAFLAGATSDLDLVSGYCLNKLPSFPDQTISNEAAKRLRALADNPARPAGLRISAEQTALRYSGTTAPAQSEVEYAWLRGVLQAARQSTNAGADLQAYLVATSPMITRLFEFKNKQEETADYLLRLIADQTAPTALRAAAASTLSSWDSEVFNFKIQDERFDRMFATYIGLLSDKSPDLRIMGVVMLFDRTMTIMKTRTPPDRIRQYAQKAAQALTKAMAAETDERVKTFLGSRADTMLNGNLILDNEVKEHLDEFRRIYQLQLDSRGTDEIR